MTGLFRDTVASVVLGLLAVLAWPLAPWTHASVNHITITATGMKDSGSQGSEVWLTGLPDGLDMPTLLASHSTPDGWESRDGVAVSYQGQPSTLRFDGPLDGKGAFVFVRHPWSGKVTIDVNGVSRTEDLYAAAPNAEPLTLDLAGFPKGEVQVFSHWPEFILGFLRAAAAIFVALRAFSVLPVLAMSGPSASYASDTVRHALPALGVFTVVLLGAWPAQMSPDSVSQWYQLASGHFDNAHPLLHTLLIGGPGYLLGSPGWSMLLQIVLLALACGALTAEIRRWGVSPAFAWLVACLVPLLPGVHLLAPTFWKDIPYAAAIAGLTVMVMAVVRTRGAVCRGLPFMAAFATILFLVATLRHNGILVAAATVLLLGAVMWRSLRMRFVTIAVAAGVALPVLWSAAVLPALGVAGLGRHYGGVIPMHLLGGMIAADAIGDKDALARLDAILPFAQWRSAYDCLNIVPLFWAPGISYEKIDASLFGPALRAVIDAPGVALHHLVCVNSSAWRLSPTENAVNSLVPLGIWEAGPPYDGLGLVHAPVVSEISAAMQAEFAWTTGGTLRFVAFWRPALMFLALAVCLGFAVTRNRAAIMPLLLASAPTVLNTLSMVALTGSQDFRYQLPIYLIGPFLMAAAIAAGQAGRASFWPRVTVTEPQAPRSALQAA